MIRDLPDSQNLLETALASLRADLLPHLPNQARYNGLMVANALAIVLRDLQAAQARRHIAETLTGLIGRDDAPALCAAIDAGRFDEPAPDAILRQALLTITRARLSISNPKALG